MEKKLCKTIITYLHYLYPQLRCAEKCLKQNGNPERAYYHILAARKLILIIIEKYFDDLLHKHLASEINRLSDQYSHEPETHQTLYIIRSAFPKYQLSHIPKVLHQLKALEQNFNPPKPQKRKKKPRPS